MSGCLGDVAAALVDGELDHAARERAQRHLAHCAACRAEVDAQRRLRARLQGLPAPVPSDALLARLRALEVPGPALPGARTADSRAGTAPVRPVGLRPAARAAGPAAPPGRPRRRTSRRRRAAAGSAFAALGVAAALALGSPPSRPASTPVDPAADAFVTEFVGVTGDGADNPFRNASVTGTSTSPATTGGERSGR